MRPQRHRFLARARRGRSASRSSVRRRHRAQAPGLREHLARRIGDQEQVGADLPLVLLGDRLHRRRILRVIAAFRFDRSATSRASRAKCSNSVVRYSSSSVPASSRPRRSSFSACAVTATLTRYTATPIATTASSALARKMRLVSDEKIVIAAEREVDLDFAPGVRHDDAPRLERRRFVPRDDGVGARRHVLEPVRPSGVGDGEVAVREHEDERAHVRMDVAEHAHDARAIEAHRLRAARPRSGRGRTILVFESENTLW